MAVVTVAYNELDSWLQAQPANTTDTPYELNITGLTINNVHSSSIRGTLGYVLINNNTKYVDLSNTILPASVTNMLGCFDSCISLTTAPNIPNSVTSMYYCFSGCISLTTAPNIPNSVTSMYYCFSGCTSLTTAPDIPNSVTDMYRCFGDCTSLTAAPDIPNSVTDMRYCFYGCTSLTTAPNIPNSVTSMYYCFSGCTSLTTAPDIPNSVTDLFRCFYGCTSLTIVPNVPNSVTRMDFCFYGCTSLEEITLFEVDLETLIANDNALGVFQFCESLAKIGIPAESPVEESDWHCFRLFFDSNSVQGKVYDKTGTAVTIPQTTVTKSTLKLPIKTDELWFPTGYTDAQIDDIIENVIWYRYSYFNDSNVLDPSKKNFVLWADDPDNSYSNLKINVASADKLSTARNLKVALGSSNAQSFDGSADATSIGVDGTLPVANGGTGQTDLANVTVGGAINGVIGRLGGAFGTSKTTFTELLAEISNASGGGGIVGGSISNVADKGIPAGWHNFLYIPHRNGTGGDNYQYGTLFVTDMTANTSNFWVIHKNSGTVNNAVKIDSRIAEQANYTCGNAFCTTDGATQAKVASMRGYVLQSGATFPITFTNANSYNGVITLNVNSTGAKNIYINNAVTSSSNKTLPAGTYMCRYNGSYYYIDTSYFVTSARNANYASTATDAYYVGSGRGAVTGYYMSPSYDNTNNWVKLNGYYGTGSFNSRNSCADIALKIRTSAPSSPADGDIWIE